MLPFCAGKFSPNCRVMPQHIGSDPLGVGMAASNWFTAAKKSPCRSLRIGSSSARTAPAKAPSTHFYPNMDSGRLRIPQAGLHSLPIALWPAPYRALSAPPLYSLSAAGHALRAGSPSAPRFFPRRLPRTQRQTQLHYAIRGTPHIENPAVRNIRLMMQYRIQNRKSIQRRRISSCLSPIRTTHQNMAIQYAIQPDFGPHVLQKRKWRPVFLRASMDPPVLLFRIPAQQHPHRWFR